MRDLLCWALCRLTEQTVGRVGRAAERTSRALEHWLDMDTAGQCTHPASALTTQGTRYLRCSDCNHHFPHPFEGRPS